jgi:hypothetical protein
MQKRSPQHMQVSQGEENLLSFAHIGCCPRRPDVAQPFEDGFCRHAGPQKEVLRRQGKRFPV